MVVQAAPPSGARPAPNCCRPPPTAAATGAAHIPPALQWNATGTYVNYPFGSKYPPYVIRTVEGDAPDTIVLVSDFDGSSYTLSAYDAATGGWSPALEPLKLCWVNPPQSRAWQLSPPTLLPGCLAAAAALGGSFASLC